MEQQVSKAQQLREMLDNLSPEQEAMLEQLPPEQQAELKAMIAKMLMALDKAEGGQGPQPSEMDWSALTGAINPTQ